MPSPSASIINPKPVQLGLAFDLAAWPFMRGWQISEWQVLEPAARAALEQFQREYKGSRCVCRARKMRSTPFCRECMELLRKAKLMRQFNVFNRIIAMGNGRWLETENGVRSYFRHYDLCRDFLLNTRNAKRQRRAA